MNTKMKNMSREVREFWPKSRLLRYCKQRRRQALINDHLEVVACLLQNNLSVRESVSQAELISWEEGK
jgi:hypothetical protein